MRKDHTIIFSTHIMQEVSAVCERIVIINKGRIVAVDTPENLARAISKSLRLTFKIAGEKSSVIAALQAVDGVRNVEVQDKVEDDVYVYIVDADKGVDVRKPIFFAMADLGYPILETKEDEMGLEEIFRELTTKDVAVNDESEGSGRKFPKVHRKEPRKKYPQRMLRQKRMNRSKKTGRNRTVLRPRKRRLRNNVGCL